jgi:hypothetical protein
MKSSRASILLIALVVLIGASCSGDDPTSPDRAAATQLRFVVQPNDAQIDTWQDPYLHEELGFLEGTLVHASVEILDANGARATWAKHGITIALGRTRGAGRSTTHSRKHRITRTTAWRSSNSRSMRREAATHWSRVPTE